MIATQPTQASPEEALGIGLLLFGLGVMQIGVLVEQMRGRGPAVLRSRWARFLFSEDYMPRFLRTATGFDRTMRGVGGVTFALVGLFVVIATALDALAG
jgi:hypothetical protein